jgi:hypothetical protein
MVTTRPERAESTSYRQYLPAGFDPGNGSAKLLVDGTETRIPSLIQPLHTDIYDVPECKDGSLITYLSGDRSDLVGQRWFAGRNAYLYAPLGHQKVLEDSKGKIKFGLQLLLGALGTLPRRPEWKLGVILSIQDAKVFGDELAESVAGRHTISIGSNVSVSHVCIDVESVVDEGAGAIAHAITSGSVAPNSQTIVLDFGHGTTIITPFGAKGKAINRRVINAGVSDLIEAIAKNIDTRRQLHAEGDRQLIREGIERGDFTYGTTDWNFRSVYNNELSPWVQSVLSPSLKACAPWKATSEAILAIGGGSMLPAISQLLTKQGITTIGDGCWANARGLEKLAQLKLGRAK